MTDPTAAERARRYRARRRDRDGSVTSREPELVAVVGQLVAEVRALAELVRAGYAQPAGDVDNRDAGARHAVRRDVTEPSRTEGAPAPARVGTRLTGPTGPSEPTEIRRDVTPELRERILVALRAAPGPASAPALGDALDIPYRTVLETLVELTRAGIVRRIAGETARDRDVWAPIVASPGETIRCAAYREHAISGHRRDPGSGRFRCYICEPESGQLTAAI